MQEGLNFHDWNDFFKKIPFTYYRTSLIQKKYIEVIDKFTPQNGKLLEIAAGSGYTSAVVSDLVRKKNATVTMSDLEPDLVNSAAIKYSTFGMEFVQADSLDLGKFKNNEFDVLFHQGFLEHFSDDLIKQFLREQARVAKHVVFDVPNGRRWNKTQEFGNERFLSHNTWLAIAEEAGLTIEYHTARRFTNSWKNWVPVAVQESEFFHRHFGEASIVVCSK